jgi:hypothetical protein
MFDDENPIPDSEKSDVRKRMEGFYRELSEKDKEFLTGMMRKGDAEIKAEEELL